MRRMPRRQPLDHELQELHLAARSADEVFVETDPNGPDERPNPIGTQYLDGFLEDIGSFNIGVRGEGNRLGRNIGAAEFANAAPNAHGELALPDALGFDHDEDGAGDGYNVPSLLGIYALPPYLHNGACETLLCVLTDVEHRTAGNETDVLNTRTKRNRVAKFLELIDLETVPIDLPSDAPNRRDPSGVAPACFPLCRPRLAGRRPCVRSAAPPTGGASP